MNEGKGDCMTKHLVSIFIALLVASLYTIATMPQQEYEKPPLSAKQEAQIVETTPPVEPVQEKVEEVKKEVIEQKPSRGGQQGRYMEVTAYTGAPDEGGGITASGKKVRRGMCATGSEYRIGTVLYVEGFGEVVVEDRGVSNGHLDLAVDSKKEAFKLGRTIRKVYVVSTPN